MPDAGWVAVAGVVGGVAGVVSKGWLDVILAKGKVREDREARAEARRDKRAERRDDLQRDTLLDLQHAAMALASGTASGYQLDALAAMGAEPVPWSKYQWPADLANEVRVAQARIRLLRSRVRDGELRTAVATFSTACSDQGSVADKKLADEAKARADQAFEYLLDRAGQLVREMDEV